MVYNADDEWSARLAAPYPGAIGFTLRTPGPGQVGVVEDLLVDRAFTGDPVRTAEELASLEDVRPFAPHNVANALAAAALARAFGVSCEAVRQGLRDFVPDPHRIAHVARVAEVDYVDDSKATNPHAAAASLAAYPAIVWVAGGQLKGADVDELVRQAAPGCAAPCSWAPTASGSAGPWRDTPRMSRWSRWRGRTLGSWTVSSPKPPGSPPPETPCCWPRREPPGHVHRLPGPGRRSPGPCTGSRPCGEDGG
nr:hypothetical protein GCM10020093_115120 [Planobispora longispora]